jgi:hypothetical protein
MRSCRRPAPVRGFLGRFAALAAHGDAGIGALQRGRVVDPSPVMATVSPCDCSAMTRRSLCSGLVRAKTSVSSTTAASRRVVHAVEIGSGQHLVAFRSPICRPIAAAVPAWSPVIIFTRMPAAGIRRRPRWLRGAADRSARRAHQNQLARRQQPQAPYDRCALAAEGQHALALGGHASAMPRQCLVQRFGVAPSGALRSAAHASICSGAPLTWTQRGLHGRGWSTAM